MLYKKFSCATFALATCFNSSLAFDNSQISSLSSNSIWLGIETGASLLIEKDVNAREDDTSFQDMYLSLNMLQLASINRALGIYNKISFGVSAKKELITKQIQMSDLTAHSSMSLGLELFLNNFTGFRIGGLGYAEVDKFMEFSKELLDGNVMESISIIQKDVRVGLGAEVGFDYKVASGIMLTINGSAQAVVNINDALENDFSKAYSRVLLGAGVRFGF